MWEFQHDRNSVSAKINDIEWLKRFQMRDADVRPGDALRAQVIQIVNYGHDNEVISTKYEVDTVIEIIREEPQSDLFG